MWHMNTCIVRPVPADGFALLGGRISADTVRTSKWKCCPVIKCPVCFYLSLVMPHIQDIESNDIQHWCLKVPDIILRALKCKSIVICVLWYNVHNDVAPSSPRFDAVLCCDVMLCGDVDVTQTLYLISLIHEFRIKWKSAIYIRPNSQIPQCTCPTSHNAPFRTEMCAFLFWMVHCGIWDRCIVGLWIWSILPLHKLRNFVSCGRARPSRIGLVPPACHKIS